MKRSNWIWAVGLAAAAWWVWRHRRPHRLCGPTRAYEPVERASRRVGTDPDDAAAWEAESGAMRDA
jgi:hypothetical protein